MRYTGWREAFPLGRLRITSRISTGVELEERRHARLIRLHLTKAFDPPDGERDFAFDDGVAFARQRHPVAADLQPSVFPIRKLSQRDPQRVVEVDVRRPLPAQLDIKRSGRQIDSGIHATAA